MIDLLTTFYCLPWLILVALVAHDHAYRVGYDKGYVNGHIEGKLQEYRQASAREPNQ